MFANHTLKTIKYAMKCVRVKFSSIKLQPTPFHWSGLRWCHRVSWAQNPFLRPSRDASVKHTSTTQDSRTWKAPAPELLHTFLLQTKLNRTCFRSRQFSSVWKRSNILSSECVPSRSDICSCDKWNRQPSSHPQSTELCAVGFSSKESERNKTPTSSRKKTLQKYFVIICLVVSNYDQVMVFPSILD